MTSRGFLERIVAQRREQVARERAACDWEVLGREAELVREGKPRHRFHAAFRTDRRVHIIAEFKRASPSRGLLRADANAAAFALLYESAGACAVSVLTEPDFFRGSLGDLHAVRSATALPVLRKDFVIDTYQITQTAAAGADAILLIAAALNDDELPRFRAYAEDDLGLDALVEVHTVRELQRALACAATLIGVNNRDLRTFQTTLATSHQLAALVPPGVTLISESGISSRAEIERLLECGYRGFLVGEALMRDVDPAAALRSLGANRSGEMHHA
ncbi:MAG: indole-3-glycerol phosphate synthase TrpC [Chthoniobacterales bacterium]